MKEQFYDEHIAPALLELAKKCEEQGIALLAVCEWEPGKWGRTFQTSEKMSAGIRIADAAIRSDGNVDLLWIAIQRMATREGHSSAFLQLQGIPTTPKVR